MNNDESSGFKKLVQRQYRALKEVEDKEARVEEMRERSRSSSKGLVNDFFVSVAFFFAGKGFKMARRKAPLVKKLLSNEQIKQRICKSIPQNEAGIGMSDTAIISLIVDAVTEPKFMEVFAIPYDDELFAVLCDQVIRSGLEAYCRK